MTGLQLKRFFKTHYGIPVLASAGKHYCSVRIKPDPRPTRTVTSSLGGTLVVQDVMAPLKYSHAFPAELGNRCMRLVYARHEKLCQQNWGGNIEAHSIAMSPRDWEALVAQFEPVDAR